MQPSQSDDHDFARAILIVEKLRAQLNANDGGAYAVCRDAALEAGFMFSAKRCRRVNVKKSNRPTDLTRSMRTLNSWFRDVYGGALDDVIPRSGAALDAMRGVHAENFIIDDAHALSPRRGFTFAGAPSPPRTAAGRLHQANELLGAGLIATPGQYASVLETGQIPVPAPGGWEPGDWVSINGERLQVDDRTDAESLAAAINASPTLPAVATVHEGRVIIASTPARVGARDLLFREPAEPGSLFGINASSYELWRSGKALTWKSDLVFNEIRGELAAAEAGDDHQRHLRAHSAVLDRIDLSNRSITYRAVERQIGRSYERPVVLSTPRQPKFRPDTKSRVPRHVQQQQFGRRLDGRRR